MVQWIYQSFFWEEKCICHLTFIVYAVYACRSFGRRICIFIPISKLFKKYINQLMVAYFSWVVLCFWMPCCYLVPLWLSRRQPRWRRIGTGQSQLLCHYTCVWVRSIAKPGNKTVTVPWPDPYAYTNVCQQLTIKCYWFDKLIIPFISSYCHVY